MAGDRSHPRSRAWAHAQVAVVTTIVTSAGYLALLGWDQDGLYGTWQVALLMLVLGALAVWATVQRAMWTGAVAATIVMTVAFSVDAATDVEDDGLWPVGAVGVLFGTFIEFVVVGLAVDLIRRWNGTRRHVRTLG